MRAHGTPSPETRLQDHAPHGLPEEPQVPPPRWRRRRERGGARRVTWPRREDVAPCGRPTCPSPRPVAAPALRAQSKMAAPSGGRHSGGGGASLWVALLLAAVALRPAEAVSEPTTVAFDVRPGGVVHSFSQNAGPGVRAATSPGARGVAGAGPEEGTETVRAGLEEGAGLFWRGVAPGGSVRGRGFADGYGPKGRGFAEGCGP